MANNVLDRVVSVPGIERRVTTPMESTAIAEAEKEVGKTHAAIGSLAQKEALDLGKRINVRDAGDAESQFYQDAIKISAETEEIKDHTTWQKEHNKRLGEAINRASKNITDADTLAVFKSRISRVAAGRRESMRVKYIKKEHQFQAGKLINFVDGNLKSILETNDPNIHKNTYENVNRRITTGVQNGDISPLVGESMRRKFAQDFSEGMVNTMETKAALAALKSNRNDKDPSGKITYGEPTGTWVDVIRHDVREKYIRALEARDKSDNAKSEQEDWFQKGIEKGPEGDDATRKMSEAVVNRAPKEHRKALRAQLDAYHNESEERRAQEAYGPARKSGTPYGKPMEEYIKTLPSDIQDKVRDLAKQDFNDDEAIRARDEAKVERAKAEIMDKASAMVVKNNGTMTGAQIAAANKEWNLNADEIAQLNQDALNIRKGLQPTRTLQSNAVADEYLDANKWPLKKLATLDRAKFRRDFGKIVHPDDFNAILKRMSIAKSTDEKTLRKQEEKEVSLSVGKVVVSNIAKAGGLTNKDNAPLIGEMNAAMATHIEELNARNIKPTQPELNKFAAQYVLRGEVKSFWLDRDVRRGQVAGTPDEKDFVLTFKKDEDYGLVADATGLSKATVIKWAKVLESGGEPLTQANIIKMHKANP